MVIRGRLEDVDECEPDVECDKLVDDFIPPPMPKLIMETLRITTTITVTAMNATG